MNFDLLLNFHQLKYYIGCDDDADSPLVSNDAFL